MRPTSALFAVAVAAAGIVAAPVPRETPAARQLRLFGKADDPTAACTYAIDGEALRIAMPGRVEAAATKLKDAPRTVREVAGDFTAVAVVRYVPPKPGDDKPGGHLGAGVAAWVDDDNYLMINRHHWPAEEGWAGGFDTHGQLADAPTVSHGAVGAGIASGDAGHLRIVRKGNELAAFYSTDRGATWTQTGRVEGDWPARLKVGVVGFNITTLDAEAVFDSLTVTAK